MNGFYEIDYFRPWEIGLYWPLATSHCPGDAGGCRVLQKGDHGPPGERGRLPAPGEPVEDCFISK